MRLLLDSHIAFWSLTDPDKLGDDCRERIEDGNNIVFVSSATVWELRLKWSRGKLTLPEEFESKLWETGFAELKISWSHATRTSRLPDIHQDPFDRILIAQALEDDLVLVTRDGMIQKYEVPLLRG